MWKPHRTLSHLAPRAPALTLQVRHALQSFHSTMGTHSDTAVSAALQSGHQRILTKTKMTTPSLGSGSQTADHDPQTTIRKDKYLHYDSRQ